MFYCGDGAGFAAMHAGPLSTSLRLEPLPWIGLAFHGAAPTSPSRSPRVLNG